MVFESWDIQIRALRCFLSPFGLNLSLPFSNFGHLPVTLGRSFGLSWSCDPPPVSELLLSGALLVGLEEVGALVFVLELLGPGVELGWPGLVLVSSGSALVCGSGKTPVFWSWLLVASVAPVVEEASVLALDPHPVIATGQVRTPANRKRRDAGDDRAFEYMGTVCHEANRFASTNLVEPGIHRAQRG